MAKELADLSAPGGDKYTWEQLPDAITALEDGNDIDYEGASGPINLNEDGDPMDVCVLTEPIDVQASASFTPLRLADVSDLDAGHEASTGDNTAGDAA